MARIEFRFWFRPPEGPETDIFRNLCAGNRYRLKVKVFLELCVNRIQMKFFIRKAHSEVKIEPPVQHKITSEKVALYEARLCLLKLIKKQESNTSTLSFS